MSTTTNTDAVRISFTYDTEPCSRCGGTGSHSRCEQYGTDCFKCVLGSGVRGKQNTKAAVEARAAIRAFREQLLSVEVADLKIGDVVNATSARAGQARHDKPCRLTIVSISAPRLSGIGGSGSEACRWLEAHAHLSAAEQAALLAANPVEGVTVHYVVDIAGQKQTISASPGATLLRWPTADDVRAVAAFARTLEGVTVTER